MKRIEILGLLHLVFLIDLDLGNSYNNQERTLAAGYDNGDVKLFDMRNMSLLWETNVKNGVFIEMFRF